MIRRRKQLQRATPIRRSTRPRRRKPTTVKQRLARGGLSDRAMYDARLACKEHCNARDGRCRAQCPDGCDGWTETHEEPPRSTGGDPIDPRDAMNLCKRAHDRRHGHGTKYRMSITKLSLRGAEGPLEFSWKGQTWRT